MVNCNVIVIQRDTIGKTRKVSSTTIFIGIKRMSDRGCVFCLYTDVKCRSNKKNKNKNKKDIYRL